MTKPKILIVERNKGIQKKYLEDLESYADVVLVDSVEDAKNAFKQHQDLKLIVADSFAMQFSEGAKETPDLLNEFRASGFAGPLIKTLYSREELQHEQFLQSYRGSNKCGYLTVVGGESLTHLVKRMLPGITKEAVADREDSAKFFTHLAEFKGDTLRRVNAMIEERIDQVHAPAKIMRFRRNFQKKILQLTENQDFIRGGDPDYIQDAIAKAKDIVIDLKLAQQTYGIEFESQPKTTISEPKEAIQDKLNELEQEAKVLLGR